MSVERQKEIETLQEIITSLTLQLRERDKHIKEIKQSVKGNYYYYVSVTFHCMVLFLDLTSIPNPHKPITDQGLEGIQTEPNQEKESIAETTGSNII